MPDRLAHHSLLAIDRRLIPDLLHLLFGTHAFYHDRESRLATQKCLAIIVTHGIESDTLGPLVKTLRLEGQKHGIAPSNAFVLLEWCGLLMHHLAASPLWDEFGADILLAHADVLEKCLQPASRKSLASSAVGATRRAFRKLFLPVELQKKNLTDAVRVLTTKSTQPTAKNALMLGVVAGVSSRQASLKPILETQKSRYYEFYIREVIGSRTAVPDHVASGLADFFSDFAALDDVEKELIPPIEKGLLRAPEVILSGVLKPLVLSFPADFDLSGLLSAKLLKPLLSNIKSSNANIRSGALSSFRAIVTRCHDLEAMSSVVDEIANPLKAGKLTSPEHRILHAEMLETCPLSAQSSERVTTALAMTASKEGNEAALAAETSTLAHASVLVLGQGGELPKLVLDIIIKGLGDKKPASRRLWLLCVGAVFLAADVAAPKPALVSLAEAVTPKLVDNFNEVIANPATAVQNGSVVGAYILTVLVPTLLQLFPGSSAGSILTKASVTKNALSVNAKQSFLLNHRVYTKLSGEQDLRWLSLALSSVMKTLDRKSDQEVVLAWSDAIIYLITASAVPSKVQQETAKAVSLLYAKDTSLVGDFVIDGLWNFLAPSESKDRDSKVDSANLIHVLRAICVEPAELNEMGGTMSTEAMEKQACRLLVLSRSELIPRSSWIGLCLRMGLDPGDLARRHENTLLKEVGHRASFDQLVCIPDLEFLLQRMGNGLTCVNEV